MNQRLHTAWLAVEAAFSHPARNPSAAQVDALLVLVNAAWAEILTTAALYDAFLKTGQAGKHSQGG